jgi:hypothetical protein
MQVASGVFNAGTGAVGTTYNLTPGWQPTLIVFLHGGRTSSATTDGATASSCRKNFGVYSYDGTTEVQRGLAYRAADGQATMVVSAGMRDDAAFVMVEDGAWNGYHKVRARATWPADGFSMEVVDVPTYNSRAFWIAFEGVDLEDFAIGAILSATAAGLVDTTGLGLKPDALMLFGIPEDAAFASGSLLQAASTGSAVSIGFGARSTSDVISQAVLMTGSDDAAPTAVSAGYCRSGEIYAMMGVADTVDTIERRASLDSMLTDGFRLNWLAVEGATSRWHIFYLAIKGPSAHVGSFLTSGTAGTAITETGVGFTGKAILTISACRPESTAGVTTPEDRWSIGYATDAAAQGSHTGWDVDAQGTSECAAGISFASMYSTIRRTAANAYAEEGQVGLDSFTSDGWTATQDVADADTTAAGTASNFVAYLILGDAPPPPPPPGMQFTAGQVSSSTLGRSRTFTADTTSYSIVPGHGTRTFTAAQASSSVLTTAGPVGGAGSSTGAATVTGVGAAIVSGVGSASGVATATGVGSALVSGVGVASGIATADAVGTSVASGAGSSAGVASSSAIGTATIAGAGTANGASTVTGTGASVGSGAGVASGIASASAVGATTASGAGSAAGAATVVGSSAADTLLSGAGASSGVATVSGVGAAIASGVGSAAGSGAATGHGSSIAAGAGVTAGTAVATGVAASLAAGAGSSQGTATAAATANAVVRSAGSAAGVASVSGVGMALEQGASTGSAAGVATVSGVGRSTAQSSGAAAGVASVSGVGAATTRAAGSAGGVATATGDARAIIPGVGTSAGVATAVAVGRSTVAGAGVSSGVATVTGTGLALGTGGGAGASAGTSTAQGVGRATVSSVGLSSGSATVIGVGGALVPVAGAAAGVADVAATARLILSGAGSADGVSTVSAESQSIAAGAGLAVGIATVTGIPFRTRISIIEGRASFSKIIEGQASSASVET